MRVLSVLLAGGLISWLIVGRPTPVCVAGVGADLVMLRSACALIWHANR